MKVKVNKKIKLISILLVLVMLISVGYALLSTTLTINGTANVKASSWKIYFTNVQPTEGGVTPTTAPTVPENSKDTTELEWVVSFNTPGQFYEFTVDAVNEGTIDAMISTATADIVTSQLTEAQRKYLDYTVTYSDGAPIEQHDRLAAGATETLRVRVAFKTDVEAEDLPETAQEITAFTYTANYVKADENAKDRQIAEPEDEDLGKLRAYLVGKTIHEVMNTETGKFIDNEILPDASSMEPAIPGYYDGSTFHEVLGMVYNNNVYWVGVNEETYEFLSVDPLGNGVIERLNAYYGLLQRNQFGAALDQENNEYIKDTLGVIDSNIKILSDTNILPVVLEYNGQNYCLTKEATTSQRVIDVYQTPKFKLYINPATGSTTLGNNEEYSFDPGMTWQEFVESEYNNGEFTIDNNTVKYNGVSLKIINYKVADQNNNIKEFNTSLVEPSNSITIANDYCADLPMHQEM